MPKRRRLFKDVKILFIRFPIQRKMLKPALPGIFQPGLFATIISLQPGLIETEPSWFLADFGNLGWEKLEGLVLRFFLWKT